MFPQSTSRRSFWPSKSLRTCPTVLPLTWEFSNLRKTKLSVYVVCFQRGLLVRSKLCSETVEPVVLLGQLFFGGLPGTDIMVLNSLEPFWPHGPRIGATPGQHCVLCPPKFEAWAEILVDLNCWENMLKPLIS